MNPLSFCVSRNDFGRTSCGSVVHRIHGEEASLSYSMHSSQQRKADSHHSLRFLTETCWHNVSTPFLPFPHLPFHEQKAPLCHCFHPLESWTKERLFIWNELSVKYRSVCFLLDPKRLLFGCGVLLWDLLNSVFMGVQHQSLNKFCVSACVPLLAAPVLLSEPTKCHVNREAEQGNGSENYPCRPHIPWKLQAWRSCLMVCPNMKPENLQKTILNVEDARTFLEEILFDVEKLLSEWPRVSHVQKKKKKDFWWVRIRFGVSETKVLWVGNSSSVSGSLGQGWWLREIRVCFPFNAKSGGKW